jgi:hypothetical protein
MYSTARQSCLKREAQTISQLTAPATEWRAQTDAGSMCISILLQKGPRLYPPKIYMPVLRFSFQTRQDEDT